MELLYDLLQWLTATDFGGLACWKTLVKPSLKPNPCRISLRQVHAKRGVQAHILVNIIDIVYIYII